MRNDDPSLWAWDEPQPPQQYTPIVVPPPRSPYSPSWKTKLAGLIAFLLVVPGGLAYVFRYDLGLADGHYAFLQMQPGDPEAPVTYPSCLPLHYAVNPEHEVLGGEKIIDEAVGRISGASGLRFVKLAPTDLRPQRGGVPGGTVLIAWADPAEVPGLTGNTIGQGGSSAMTMKESGNRYYVSGEISLDAPDLTRILRDRGADTVRAVVMHELGHVLGLAHVDDRYELMNEDNLGRTDFGRGDLEGLALLGKGGCESQP